MKYSDIYKRNNKTIINELKQQGTPPSENRMKGCLSKTGYDSEWEAMISGAERGLNFYKCTYCRHWHLTSKGVNNK